MEQKVLKGFTPEQQSFICSRCFAGFDVEKNRPMVAMCCHVSCCEDCIRNLLKTSALTICPFGQHSMKPAQHNYEMIQLLESFIRSQKVNKETIFKTELKIGMFPEKMIVQFMDGFYLRNKEFNFYDKKTRAVGFQLEPMDDSYLNEQVGIITLQQGYYFT